MKMLPCDPSPTESATTSLSSRRFAQRLLSFLFAAGICSFASAADIHEATRRGDLGAVRRLIESNPPLVAARDAEGCTPLHLAAQLGEVPLVDLLLAHGADPNAMHGSFSTPLSEALAGGHRDVAELLRQRGGLDPLPLLEAGDVAGLRSALELKPQWVQFRDQFGTTLLFHAALLRQIAIVQLLLDLKADPNVANRWGMTALTPAIAAGDTKLTELFLQYGAAINTPLHDGTTAVFVGARLGHAEMVKLLLAKGADLSIRHRERQTTALHAAVAGSLIPASASVEASQLDRLQTELFKDLAIDPFGIDPQSGAQAWRESLKKSGLELPAGLLKRIAKFLVDGKDHLAAADALIASGADREARDKLGRTPLALAAGIKSLPMVELLLAHKADLEARDAAGMTPLNLAARAGSLPVVRALLARGAALEATDNAGFAPLQSAVESDSLEVVEELLTRGAQVNREVGDGRIALHAAATGGHAAIAKLLLRHGATLDARDRKGQNTPLMLAARYGHGETFHALVAAGADFRSRGGNAWTLLHQAAAKDDLERMAAADTSKELPLEPPKCGNDKAAIAEWLLTQGADIEARDGNGSTPLLVAASAGNIPVAELLVVKGANPNVASKNRSPPLHFAAIAGNTRLIELLLERGADAKAIDGESRNALHYASAHATVALFEILVRHGASLTQADRFGLRPLHTAAHAAPPAVVAWCLEHRSDIGATDQTGNTALHRAALGGNTAVVELLLAKGADVNQAALNDYRPLHHAAQQGHAQTVEALLAHGAKIHAATARGGGERQAIHFAAEGGHVEVLKVLLARNADPSVCAVQQATSLHLAALNGRADAVRFLLEHGASVEARDQAGGTPLLQACLKGDPATVRILLSRGAAVDAQYTNGMTALHAAAVWRATGAFVSLGQAEKIEVIKLLLEAGADPTVQSKDRLTPLDVALQGGARDIARFLMNAARPAVLKR